MYNLLLKDILIQKKTIGITILISIVYTFMLKNNISVLFTMYVFMFSYIFIFTACSYDDKSEKMMNSLPVKRIDIVLSKYASIFLFLIISFAIFIFVVLILKITGLIHTGSFITLKKILEASFGVILLSSIYFPIYFKFGYSKTKYINVGIFALIFFVVSFLSQKAGKYNIDGFIQNLNSMPEWGLYTGVILIAFIILLISFVISYFAYKNREFN